MSTALVPKVMITEAAGSLQVPRQNLIIIGVIGTSQQGTQNVPVQIDSVSQADALFGSNYSNGASLVPMIRRAFQEGASRIIAVSVGQPTLDVANEAVTVESNVWAVTLTVGDGTLYAAGDIVFVGTGNSYQYEEKRAVLSSTATTVTFTQALTFKHYVGETIQTVTAKTSASYTAAISAMEENEEKGIVVCERNDDSTASLLATMVNNSMAIYNSPCIYIRSAEPTDTEVTIVAKAVAHNDKRVVVVYPVLTDFNGKTVPAGEVAAAIAGVIAGNGVPKLNHNFTSLSGFGGVGAKVSNMDTLISGGVTPVELKYNTIHIVRFVTTSTIKDLIPDYTWAEAAVRLNVDYIERYMSAQLTTKFMQQGNTPQIRLAIKTECVAMLTTFATSNVIVADERTGTPAFKEPVVSTDPADATKVNVDIEIAPGKPLNFISLNFKVYL